MTNGDLTKFDFFSIVQAQLRVRELEARERLQMNQLLHKSFAWLDAQNQHPSNEPNTNVFPLKANGKAA